MAPFTESEVLFESIQPIKPLSPLEVMVVVTHLAHLHILAPVMVEEW